MLKNTGEVSALMELILMLEGNNIQTRKIFDVISTMQRIKTDVRVDRKGV